MSFNTASAILRGKWLIDKQWANAHMPIVYSFMKGDAGAAKLLMGGSEDDEDENDNGDPVNLAKNIYSISPRTKLSDLPANSIVYVDIDGPLFKMGDWCSYGMEDYSEMFYAIANAGNITGVILDLDSPGGQCDGTATFGDAVRSCAAIKPVIGFVDDGLCASAAYWVISACTEIYCSQPTDAVGSIGVYCTLADWNTYYANQGLPVKDIYAPESTDKNLNYRESIAGNDALLQADLSVIAKAFIATVKTNRKGKIKGTDWATGKMFFAADALTTGLIDGIKSFDQVAFRVTRLASQKNNTNTMAFEKTLVAAKATAFAVTDEGFVLSEENLNSVEAELAAAEESNTALTASVAALEETAVSLNATVAALEATIATMGTDATLTATTINSQAASIIELQAQVSTLGSQASGKGSVITTKADNVPDNTNVPSWADDNNPSNQFADKRTGKK